MPESLFTTEYSATHILEAVKDYDIISFDIFDTLIFRPFSAPTDLFDYLAEEIGILDFKSVRIVQEWKARQDKFAVSGSYEVTLEEIWNRIECETGYPAGKGRNGRGNPHFFSRLPGGRNRRDFKPVRPCDI